MTTRARLSAEDWALIRNIWESDEREGYAWLVREQELPVSRAAASKRSSREGWEKKVTQDVPLPENVPAKSRGVTKSATKAAINKVAKKAAKVGRPTDYRDEYAEQAYRLCLMGATDKQLGDFFEVTEQTINNWKKSHFQFFDSLRRGKATADGEVAESLFKLALGYSHPDVHISTNLDGEVIQTDITKHYPPNATAIIFWLKNRQPQMWRDKVEVKEEVNINVFPARETLDAIYEKALAQAEEVEMRVVGNRAERLGIDVDNMGGDDDE